MARKVLVGKKADGILIHYMVGAIIKDDKGKYLFIKRKEDPPRLSCIAEHIFQGLGSLDTLGFAIYQQTNLGLKKEKEVLRLTVNDTCGQESNWHDWTIFLCECTGNMRSDEHDLHWLEPKEIQDLAREGYILPIWKMFLERIGIINKEEVGKMEKPLNTERIEPVIPEEHRVNICKIDDTDTRCHLLTLCSEGWTCQSSLQMGTEVRKRYQEDGKKLRQNCEGLENLK